MFNRSESSSFQLSEAYFKFVKSPVLDYFHLLLNLAFFSLSFLILDVSLINNLSYILYSINF